MRAIVAVDENWAIGYKNELVYRISADMKRFKNFTTNNVIVMGRKTLESLPNGKPLANRENVVLTSHKIDGVVCVNSIENLGKVLENFSDKDIYLIGGELTYKALLNYCEEVYVTKIRAKADKADAYFVNLDELDNWSVSDISEDFLDKNLVYNFVIYKNNKVEKING